MTTQAERRTAHPYYMYDAIQGQPAAIARVLEQERDALNELARDLNEAERIHIVGIGTSWHASLVGEYLLRRVAGAHNTRAWNSFEFCAYPPPLDSHDAVIVMTHRGTKRYSARALELASSSGAQTAVFTGIGSDARADLASHVIRTSVSDPSSAFTISHTSAMAALALLSVSLGKLRGSKSAEEVSDQLVHLPQFSRDALEKEPTIQEWAKQAKESQRLYFAGWGPNASTAYEVALKIKEAAYLTTEGFQLEQYLHGPFVATEPGCMVTFVSPPGAGYERTKDLVQAANAVGAHTVGVVEQGDSEITKLVDTAIPMPSVVEALTPIVYLIPLQLFTYWLSLEMSTNPDTFRLGDPKHAEARKNYDL